MPQEHNTLKMEMETAWRHSPIQWLEAQFQELNRLYFQGKLPMPEIALNSRLRSSAGRFIGKRVFGISVNRGRIEIAHYLFERDDGDHHARDTLAHEMVHYWLWHSKRPSGHTPAFHRKLSEMGASRYNPVPKPRTPKYIYTCLHCEKTIHAFRKLRPSACLECCTRWNHGKYDGRFLLKGKMIR